MDREFELRNLSDFELLLLLLALVLNDLGEYVDQSSLESLFIHLAGQQGGVTRMSYICRDIASRLCSQCIMDK